MWSPTHVHVTVCRVRGLLTKGKNGTNDAFVTIALGRAKFQTSVKQKAMQDVEWQEECELAIPTQGNTAEIVLTALHQNFIGVDEFLGMAVLPLSQFDVYERPRIKWYPLKSKPGQEGKNKERGEIEVRVAFTVKSGSLLDLSKKEKHKSSLGHIAQAVYHFGNKLRLVRSGSDDKNDGRLSRHSSDRFSDKFSGGEPDLGVISVEEDEFRFEELPQMPTSQSAEACAYSDDEPTVDFFNDQTVPISPVEKFTLEPGSVLLPIGTPKETPMGQVIIRDRMFSLMSTPNSEPDPDQVYVDQPNIQNTPVIDLNWLEGSPESDRSSHGFGGSEQFSSITSHTESAKTGDSAVFVSEFIDNSRMETTGMNPSKHSPDQHEADTTPAVNQSKQKTPASGASNKADMSWDMYDMRYVPTPPTGTVAAERKSLLPPEVSAVGQGGRKRISLAPCLKRLELDTSPGNISDAASPLPDIDDADDGTLVVGEDKAINAVRYSRVPHDSVSVEDRHRIYQGRSREGLISLLKDRDAEITDLKDYIDSLLLRVIDGYPTILQTPVRTSINYPSRK